MGNMSYCRFENTNNDLSDCEEYISDMDLSKDENRGRISMIETCRRIARQFEDEDLHSSFKDNSQYENE